MHVTVVEDMLLKELARQRAEVISVIDAKQNRVIQEIARRLEIPADALRINLETGECTDIRPKEQEKIEEESE